MNSCCSELIDCINGIEISEDIKRNRKRVSELMKNNPCCRKTFNKESNLDYYENIPYNEVEEVGINSEVDDLKQQIKSFKIF